MVPRYIVIGASAGGFEVLKDLVSQLPADLAAPIFVVLHIPPYLPSPLPEILDRLGPLPAMHPRDGMNVEPGMIYVAPPDHHLLVDDGRIAVKKGPKENGFRPSIDALFRSAAYSAGPGAIGVILSGALNDGTSGLWSIKRLGGIAIVQDPYEARYPSMPRSVLEYIEADFKVRSIDLAPLLVRLSREPAEHLSLSDELSEDAKRMAKEVQISAGVNLPEKSILDLGELSPFTCPQCRGALVRMVEGANFRFRCHTGHGFSADSLLKDIVEKTGDLIWQTMRGFQEASMLLEHMGGHLQQAGERVRSEKYLAKSRVLNKHASILQRMALEHQSLSADNVEQGQPTDD